MPNGAPSPKYPIRGRPETTGCELLFTFQGLNMKISQPVPAALAAFLLASAASAQSDDAARHEFSGHAWRIGDENAAVSTYRGREALSFSGRAWLDDVNLQDFVAEFDVMFEPAGFFGIGFRSQDDRNFEDIYLRNGYPGTVDALQYMPFFNGVSSWQIYTDARYNAAPEFEAGQWVRVRLVVIGDEADVYLDSGRPVLHVDDLQRETAPGYLSLRATQSSGAHFANFSVRPAGDDDRIVGEYMAFTEMPEHLFTGTLPATLIREFDVSSSFDEARMAEAIELPADAMADVNWQRLGVDANGIANIARLTPRTPDANTVMVRTIIHADTDTRRALHFGYSDRVRLYLNGELVYAANNGWQSRDWDFYGRIGLFDTAGLALREGENELIAVVSETFGGWGFMADLPDRAGLSID